MQETAQRIIGRVAPQRVLAQAYSDPEAALVSVIGRRRVGKTFLVRQTFLDRLVFEVAGLVDASMRDQLANFRLQVAMTFGEVDTPKVFTNWLEAFAHLARQLEISLAARPERCVIFLDELPWLASRRSRFLQAFSWFWNSWATRRKVVVVICGSAASWMIKKVVRDRGGLHNRITHRISLYPFSLREVGEFMEARGLVADPYQQVQLYMTLGGVPFYLNQILPGETAQVAINRLLFAKDAPLAGEFEQLYASLFSDSSQHVSVVRALSQKQRGLIRGELLIASGLSSSGSLARILEELEHSGFIWRTTPFGKKRKDALYLLMDEYTRFYLQFLDGYRPGTADFLKIAVTPSYRAWAGYEFENVALRHVDELKSALGISGITSAASSYIARPNDEVDGVQIDLLLDRADRAITLIEAKFTELPFVLSKAYGQELRSKKAKFRAHTGTQKHVTVALLTTFGIASSTHSIGLVDHVIEIGDLMA